MIGRPLVWPLSNMTRESTTAAHGTVHFGTFHPELKSFGAADSELSNRAQETAVRRCAQCTD
jgi:hypothetical protein